MSERVRFLRKITTFGRSWRVNRARDISYALNTVINRPTSSGFVNVCSAPARRASLRSCESAQPVMTQTVQAIASARTFCSTLIPQPSGSIRSRRIHAGGGVCSTRAIASATVAASDTAKP